MAEWQGKSIAMLKWLFCSTISSAIIESSWPTDHDEISSSSPIWSRESKTEKLTRKIYIQHRLLLKIGLQLTQRKTSILSSFFTEKLVSTGYDGVLRYYRNVCGKSIDYMPIIQWICTIFQHKKSCLNLIGYWYSSMISETTGHSWYSIYTSS